MPGRRVTLDIPEWDDLTASWGGTVGEVRSVAQYQRKDPRSGLLLLVIPRERGALMVKMRHSPEALDREQRLLAALQQVTLPGIRAPRPVGLGHTAGGLTWAAQEFVFSRPHEPVFALEPDRIAALDQAIGEAFHLAGLAEQRQDGWVPCHHDLTPWNLRRDHRGQVWLIDWEDAGYCPPGSDMGYLALSSAALRGEAPEPIAPEVARFYREVIERRLAQGHGGALTDAMLARLPRMGPDPQGRVAQ